MKKSDGTYTPYTAHHKAGWLQSCVPLERAMHVENQGSDNQTLTFGEFATEFITEPVDPTRIQVEHKAEGEEGSEHGEEELEKEQAMTMLSSNDFFQFTYYNQNFN